MVVDRGFLGRKPCSVTGTMVVVRATATRLPGKTLGLFEFSTVLWVSRGAGSLYTVSYFGRNRQWMRENSNGFDKTDGGLSLANFRILGVGMGRGGV